MTLGFTLPRHLRSPWHQRTSLSAPHHPGLFCSQYLNNLIQCPCRSGWDKLHLLRRAVSKQTNPGEPNKPWGGLDGDHGVPPFVSCLCIISSHPTPFHSSPLFPGLIHPFPGAFYHCHRFLFSPLALDPRRRDTSVNCRGAGRGPGLIHHSGGAAAAISSRAEPKQVIVGGEEAFFTADEEEREGWGCANATVKDEFITVSLF